MDRKSIYWLSGVVMALVLFSGLQGWAQGQSGSNGPVITHAFTIKSLRYGDKLKVYIEAEDPKADMLRIATVVDQPGYGRYPTSWVYIKSTDRKHFKGYLEWNTFSTKTPLLSEWTQITLTVSVFDKSGNESNAFAFPITFETGAKRPSSYPAPSPFDQRDLPRLGFINIELFDFTIWHNGS